MHKNHFLFLQWGLSRFRFPYICRAPPQQPSQIPTADQSILWLVSVFLQMQERGRTNHVFMFASTSELRRLFNKASAQQPVAAALINANLRLSLSLIVCNPPLKVQRQTTQRTHQKSLPLFGNQHQSKSTRTSEIFRKSCFFCAAL